MSEFIYYAKIKDAPSYMEEVVYESPRELTSEELGRLKEALEQNGREFVRVWEYKGEAPDFKGTVRI